MPSFSELIDIRPGTAAGVIMLVLISLISLSEKDVQAADPQPESVKFEHLRRAEIKEFDQYRKAAEQGHGVDQDDSQAMKLFRDLDFELKTCTK